MSVAGCLAKAPVETRDLTPFQGDHTWIEAGKRKAKTQEPQKKQQRIVQQIHRNLVNVLLPWLYWII